MTSIRDTSTILPEAPPKEPAAVDTGIIAPARSARQILWMLVGFGLSLAAVISLPQNPYILWQQSTNSILFHAKWIYERIHFDRTSIDVAVVGTSRLEAGISPQVLSNALSTRLGRQVNVANLSLVESGRDLHLSIIEELLTSHPEVKLIALSLDGDTAASHPLFKFVATKREILDSPVFINSFYFTNVLYIIYRNAGNFVQNLFPGVFQVHDTFVPKDYLGAELDRTEGYRTPDGQWVNGNQSANESALRTYSVGVVNAHQSAIRFKGIFSADALLSVERNSMRKIGRLCQSKGVRIVFVRLPMYGAEERPADMPFYRRLGPIIEPTSIGTQARYYANGGHLNRSGAIAASQKLGEALSPYL
jgi:hypothetical protein